jgi:SAM-dependent methyltransferase
MAAGGSQTLLSVLMPVYNERAFVRAAVDRVLEAPLPDGVRRELVVVDDGSSDGTAAILDELDAAHEPVRLYRHEKNRGKGAAIRTAIQAAEGEVAIFQDADLEYDPRDHARVIGPILRGDADAVYGSRFAYSEERRVLYYHHMLGNLFLTHLSNCFTGFNLTDMETCYKACRTAILKSMPIRSDGFGLEPEVTSKLAKRDCIVYEVPITYRGRSYDEGKKITWRDGVKALYVILKFWLIDDCFAEPFGRHALMTMGAARHYARFQADRARPHLGDTVLEIGSGIGMLARHLCGARDYTATDLDPFCLGFLRQRFEGREGFHVQKLDAASAEDWARFAGEGIDTVAAFNVLEHLEDDAAVVARAHELLPTGGRLVLIVPQRPGLYSRLDEQLGHKRRYDELALRALLARAGFEVEKTQGLNWLGLAGWILNGKLLRRRRLGRLQLKIFDTLVPLLRLTSWLPLPGLSLLAVARKR